MSSRVCVRCSAGATSDMIRSALNGVCSTCCVSFLCRTDTSVAQWTPCAFSPGRSEGACTVFSMLKKNKKKKTTHRRPQCLLTALLADAGRRRFVSLAFVLACRARWTMAANQETSRRRRRPGSTWNLRALLSSSPDVRPRPSGASSPVSCFASAPQPASAPAAPLYTKTHPRPNRRRTALSANPLPLLSVLHHHLA